MKLVLLVLLMWLTQSPLAEPSAGAQELYLLHCAGCHRPDGGGALPQVPSLLHTLGRLVQIEGGRGYLVRVPGAAQAPISDEELTSIVNWMLEVFNATTLPNDFKPLSLEEVATQRALILPDPLTYRAQLWQRAQQKQWAQQKQRAQQPSTSR
jgi:mono/diheme cytochrome c family protein